jgi:AcrR family transcriptional regulator
MSQSAAVLAPSPAAQERIQHIIEAAAAAMAREGYAATSMKDIAREAGVAQGLIHYYFGSKEDLVLAVLRQACAEMMDETRRSFSEASGPVMARAWAGLMAAQQRAVERPELFRLLLEMVPLAHNNPALLAQMQDMYLNICDEVAEMVDELNQQLPTPLPLPVRDFAGVIMAAIDGLAVRSLVEPGTDLAALYRAFGFLLMSSMMSSYAIAGLPLPAIDQMSELFGIAATHDTTANTSSLTSSGASIDAAAAESADAPLIEPPPGG